MFSHQSHDICRGQGQREEGCVPLTAKIYSQLQGPLGTLRREEAFRAYGTIHEYHTLHTLRHCSLISHTSHITALFMNITHFTPYGTFHEYHTHYTSYGTVQEYYTLHTLRHCSLILYTSHFTALFMNITHFTPYGTHLSIFSLLHGLSQHFSTSTTRSTNLMVGWVECEVSKIRQTTLVQFEKSHVYSII